MVKIVNKNTVKVSYRCMPNMAKVISKQNSKIANQTDQPDPPPRCSCRGGPSSCPLGGGCMVEGVVYCAQVTRLDNNQAESYTGLTGGPFKTRFNQHQNDFRHEKNKHNTCLSKHIWELKHEKIPYKIDWKILCKGRIFNPVTKTCKLCLLEKYFISYHPNTATLNDRSEMFSTCRHRLGKLLQKIKT